MNNAATTRHFIHPDWQTYQIQQGAVFEGQSIRHYGNPDAECLAAQNSNIVVDLSHLSLLQVQGKDAETFLQGQLTNDIRLVSENRAQLSGYCNAKGRMFAIFLIAKLGETYLLQLPAPLVESTLKRLRMFVLRAKVNMEIADPALVRVGVSGPDTEALITAVFSSCPTEIFDCVVQQGSSIIRLPGLHPRFEIISSIDQMRKFWDQARSRNATPCGQQPWSWLDIMAGLPNILPGTVEEFVPQMTNLELINGVSFTKGCYPGQEIVARMHYLGRLKQRMVIAHIATGDCPLPGTAVYAPDFPDQSAGSVVDAQRSPSGGFDALVVAQIQSIKNGTLHLRLPDGPNLAIVVPPYSIPFE
jgi:folate-binding protein YgfZ